MPTNEQQTTDARTASTSRVTTQEGILSGQQSPAEASGAAGTGEQEKQTEGQHPKKKPASERIHELVAQRNKSSQEAEAAKRENAELKARLAAMEARAEPIKDEERPERSKYASDEDYIEALADYKAKKAISDRERAQERARMEAEMAETAEAWNKRQAQAMKDIPDYADIVGSADVPLAPHVQQAIVESDLGPHIAYYLALNTDELKRLNSMKPVAAIRHLAKLEDEIRATEETSDPGATKEAQNKHQKSKAPEPISPVKGDTAATSGAATSFADYKRRRQEQRQAAKR